MKNAETILRDYFTSKGLTPSEIDLILNSPTWEANEAMMLITSDPEDAEVFIAGFKMGMGNLLQGSSRKLTRRI